MKRKLNAQKKHKNNSVAYGVMTLISEIEKLRKDIEKYKAEAAKYKAVIEKNEDERKDKLERAKQAGNG